MIKLRNSTKRADRVLYNCNHNESNHSNSELSKTAEDDDLFIMVILW